MAPHKLNDRTQNTLSIKWQASHEKVKVKVKVTVTVMVGVHPWLERDHLVPSPSFRIFNSFWELAQAAAETRQV